MAKRNQGLKGVYESPQAAPDGLSTQQHGGDAPTKEDVVKSANARGQRRHEVKGDQLADVNVLPSSGGESVDKTGIKDSGYLTKKGIDYGVNAMFNSLPPGTDIEDQENADIRVEPFKTYSGGLGYPGDGW
jgi:hypothetical protein